MWLEKADKRPKLGHVTGVTWVTVLGTEIKAHFFWSHDTASLRSQRGVRESGCHFDLFIYLCFFPLFCDNEKMFKLPSLCLNISPCWQQRGTPWSTVRLESAIFLESKQHVSWLEIIFCLLVAVGLGVMEPCDSACQVRNKEQAWKYLQDIALTILVRPYYWFLMETYSKKVKLKWAKILFQCDQLLEIILAKLTQNQRHENSHNARAGRVLGSHWIHSSRSPQGKLRLSQMPWTHLTNKRQT